MYCYCSASILARQNSDGRRKEGVVADRNGFVPQKLVQLWRRHRVRRIGYAVIIMAVSPAWYIAGNPAPVPYQLAFGAIALIVTTSVWLRAGDRPILDRLIAAPATAVLVDHREASGGWYDLRVVLADGDELKFRVTRRELRQYGQMLSGFCRKAEIRLPDTMRGTSA